MLLQIQIVVLKMKSNYSKLNFEEVRKYFRDLIVTEKRPVSMKTLHDIKTLKLR